MSDDDHLHYVANGQLAGFELEGDSYVMKNRDNELVDMVIQAILKCM